MRFYGELYLRSTRPLLSPEQTALEVEYLRKVFAGGQVADLGCGHGRHLLPLRAHGLDVLGLDFDAHSLQQLRLEGEGRGVVRADLRALPFRAESLAGAYSWYSSLFLFDDEQNAAVLAGVARVLRPGATLVLHTVPYERLAASPEASFDATLPDGSTLSEESLFDPVGGRDHGTRRLVTADGRTLSGSYAIRYYPLPELKQMLNLAGFSVMWVHGGVDGSPLTPDSAALIVGVQRRHV